MTDLDDQAPQARTRRTAGQLMRSRLLDVASELFKLHGFAGVSVAAIAERADAFPNQITYYFGSKEALFVEAACRDMLHIAERAETAAARTRTPNTYMLALVDTVMQADGLGLFIEALVLSRQRSDLAPQVARTVERLHGDGARAFAGEMARRGWRARSLPAEMARKFWSIALEGLGMGRTSAEMSAAMREALGEMAEER